MRRELITRVLLPLTFCLSIVCAGCYANQSNPVLRQQHPEWAAPLTLAGAPNLHKVSDDLYRGAQPTAEGIAALSASGVKTIVNFRYAHSDRDEIGDLDVQYEHIPLFVSIVNDDDALRFLYIVTNPERVPVFIHCQHGADRTGVMSAVYRIVVQGWSKEAAIQEMTEGGYGYHSIFQNLIRFLEELDVDRFRQDLGIDPQTLPTNSD